MVTVAHIEEIAVASQRATSWLRMGIHKKP